MDRTKPKFTFVEYDGDFPNLCRGCLKFEHDGTLHAWHGCLCSGGMVSFSDDYSESFVTNGPWTLEPPQSSEFSDDDHKLIEMMVNENVEQGCCGGCV